MLEVYDVRIWIQCMANIFVFPSTCHSRLASLILGLSGGLQGAEVKQTLPETAGSCA